MVTLAHNGQYLSTSSHTGLERLDSGVAERFWRLVRRYGWCLKALDVLLLVVDKANLEAHGI
jgi:CRISPR-associated endonuclease/helicase Cas3